MTDSSKVSSVNLPALITGPEPIPLRRVVYRRKKWELLPPPTAARPSINVKPTRRIEDVTASVLAVYRDDPGDLMFNPKTLMPVRVEQTPDGIRVVDLTRSILTSDLERRFQFYVSKGDDLLGRKVVRRPVPSRVVSDILAQPESVLAAIFPDATAAIALGSSGPWLGDFIEILRAKAMHPHDWSFTMRTMWELLKARNVASLPKSPSRLGVLVNTLRRTGMFEAYDIELSPSQHKDTANWYNVTCYPAGRTPPPPPSGAAPSGETTSGSAEATSPNPEDVSLFDTTAEPE